MIFIAEISKGSKIERDWIRQRRVGGLLGGVFFRKEFNRFVSDSLNEAKIAEIQDHPAVKISVISNADPFLEPNEDSALWGRSPSLDSLPEPKSDLVKSEKSKLSETCNIFLTERESGEKPKKPGRPKKETA